MALNGALTVPTVSTAVVSVLGIDDETWRTQTVWPLLIVLAAEVNAAVQPTEYSPPAMLIDVLREAPY